MKRVDDAIAARAIRVANVGFKSHARGNAVDRAGKHFANADRGYGVDGAGGFRGGFEGKDQLRGRGQRILASGHQPRASMTALAFNRNAQARRRGDVRNKSQVDVLLLKQRPLLDVQLEELVESSLR